MMNNCYVLNRKDLAAFLAGVLYSEEVDASAIKSLIEHSTYFTASVHSNNYFLAKNMQQMINNKNFPENYLSEIYAVLENQSFYLEELGSDFSSFLINHVSNKQIELDDHLLEIQEDYINKNYGKQVRYR